MMDYEISTPYLIRALARHEAEHCDGCGNRMFVKGPSGLCPFCLSGRPPRAVSVAPPVDADEPFAPRLERSRAPDAGPVGRAAGRVRRARRSRRAASPQAHLGRPNGGTPHPSAG
jgi:hypothetical protein